MFYRFFSALGTIASLIGMFFAINIPSQSFSPLLLILISGTIFLFLIHIFLEWRDHKKAMPLILKTKNEINNYMYKWIFQGGATAIFTRDMSWAKERRIEDLLREKAKKGELSICLPKQIKLTEELKKLGANIYTYEQLNHVPQSRFTIINKDRMDARVAVGRGSEKGHVIQEYSLGDHPAFSISNDLVDIITKLNRQI